MEKRFAKTNKKGKEKMGKKVKEIDSSTILMNIEIQHWQQYLFDFLSKGSSSFGIIPVNENYSEDFEKKLKKKELAYLFLCRMKNERQYFKSKLERKDFDKETIKEFNEEGIESWRSYLEKLLSYNIKDFSTIPKYSSKQSSNGISFKKMRKKELAMVYVNKLIRERNYFRDMYYILKEREN